MQIKKILVAHDFSEPADRALSFAYDMACRLAATLEVVHVHPDVYDGHSEPALGTPWPSHDQEERYLRFLDEELERVVARALPGPSQVELHRHIVRGEPVKRIESLARDLQADLICLGSTGKGAVERLLLGSISQRVVRTSLVPVLTVH
ncbi:MAG: Universal stress protein [Myxococcaceae bacterium]|nr:Universal stress protein [Myxococcaceae bacterium]